MKKYLCFLVCVVLVLTLTACDLSEIINVNCQPKVEEMMTALADGDMEAALELMHPDSANAESLQQLADYLDGRRVEKMTCTSVHKSANTGTGGTSTAETVAFSVELEDGTGIELSVVYLSDNDGEGFSTFRIQLG